MIKKSKKLYSILLGISIVGFLFTAIYALIEPKMLDGYGMYTTIIMILIFGYHIYFYIKELLRMRNNEDKNAK